MIRLPLIAGVAVLLGATALVAAGEYDVVRPVTHAATKAECGACHMAFQPALLPAASWNRVMDGLSDHFGENASLPADVAADIRAYLVQNAGRSDAVLRISEQRWWQRKHRKVADATWQRKEVGSKANCTACHAGAEQGVYDDD